MVSLGPSHFSAASSTLLQHRKAEVSTTGMPLRMGATCVMQDGSGVLSCSSRPESGWHLHIAALPELHF